MLLCCSAVVVSSSARRRVRLWSAAFRHSATHVVLPSRHVGWPRRCCRRRRRRRLLLLCCVRLLFSRSLPLSLSLRFCLVLRVGARALRCLRLCHAWDGAALCRDACACLCAAFVFPSAPPLYLVHPITLSLFPLSPSRSLARVVRRSPRSSPRCRLLASSMLFRAGVLRRSVTRVLLFILSNSRRLRWCAPRFSSSSSPLVVVSSSLLCVVPVPRVLLCAPSARGARSRCAALLARVPLPVCPVFHVCAPRSPLPSCRPASCVRPPRGFYAPSSLASLSSFLAVVLTLDCDYLHSHVDFIVG